MKHLLISFLLITIAFSSLRGSDRMNKHQNKNSKSDSESSTESYDDYSNSSSEDEYYSNESDGEYSSYSSSEDFDSDSQYSSLSYDDSDSSEDEENQHRPRPRPDDFTKSVFKTLKQIEKGILQDWRSTEDPVLQNQIRALLISNLENLLPIAEISMEPVEIQSVSTRIAEENNDNHPQPPHSRPPQPPHPRPPQPPHPRPPQPPQPKPEDEFANQVFETLHQIAQAILEQWNVEQDVAVKNQLRQNILEQLGALLPQNE